MALLAAAYVPAARLGLVLSFVQDNVTLVWPPSGIAVAALVLGGRRLWPGVAAGAFLATWSTGAPVLFAAATGVGNPLEAWLAAWLLQRAGCEPRLERLGDVWLFALLAGGLATVASASVGVAGLWLAGMAPVAALPTVWWVWWLGDAMGVLVLAPAILAWARRPSVAAPSLAGGEGAALLAGSLMVSAVVYAGAAPSVAQGPLTYAAFPFVIWAGLRFGVRGAATVALAGGALAAWGTANGYGPFLRLDVHSSLWYLHGFLAALSLTGLSLAAGRAERLAAWAELRRLNEELEGRVAIRTAELAQTVEVLQKEVRAHQGALAEVRQLSGMLPICSNCKKIRNDRGYWQSIEAYLAAHSGARFSHGICPECRRQLYPELEEPPPG
jgi:integral membrane sensor domain MASE1